MTNPRISGPADLVANIPHLLGFVPQRSLVLVGMNDGRIVVTARLDLINTFGDDTLVPSTLLAMADGGVTRVVGAMFCDVPFGTKHLYEDVVRDVVLFSAAYGIDTADVLLVHAGRFRSALCTDGCCPAEGTPLPDGPTTATAFLVAEGSAPAASREELAERVKPRDVLDEAMLDEIQVKLDELKAILNPRAVIEHEAEFVNALAMRLREPRGQASEEELARAALALSHIEVRDQVWLTLDSGSTSRSPLWQLLAVKAPAPTNVAPLFLTAWDAWRQGNGAVATVTLQRLAEVDADYSAAQLLTTLLREGISPAALPVLDASALG